jgi:hypothetical protein
VVGRGDDLLLPDVLVEVIDVAASALDLGVLLLVDVENVDVDALGVSGNQVSTSSEMKKSSRSGRRFSRARQPSIESWSVIVTKSMPRSLAMR